MPVSRMGFDRTAAAADPPSRLGPLLRVIESHVSVELRLRHARQRVPQRNVRTTEVHVTAAGRVTPARGRSRSTKPHQPPAQPARRARSQPQLQPQDAKAPMRPRSGTARAKRVAKHPPQQPQGLVPIQEADRPGSPSAGGLEDTPPSPPPPRRRRRKDSQSSSVRQTATPRAMLAPRSYSTPQPQIRVARTPGEPSPVAATPSAPPTKEGDGTLQGQKLQFSGRRGRTEAGETPPAERVGLRSRTQPAAARAERSGSTTSLGSDRRMSILTRPRAPSRQLSSFCSELELTKVPEAPAPAVRHAFHEPWKADVNGYVVLLHQDLLPEGHQLSPFIRSNTLLLVRDGDKDVADQMVRRHAAQGAVYGCAEWFEDITLADGSAAYAKRGPFGHMDKTLPFKQVLIVESDVAATKGYRDNTVVVEPSGHPDTVISGVEELVEDLLTSGDDVPTFLRQSKKVLHEPRPILFSTPADHDAETVRGCMTSRDVRVNTLHPAALAYNRSESFLAAFGDRAQAVEIRIPVVGSMTSAEFAALVPPRWGSSKDALAWKR
eukprot:TRINITY_DN2961_c0_g1_i1.p1 TRINITY_DN2961_c0_g1~~TRINITY_DN2961_c0_g1_i1.p1  ORF type:complete len:550 (+),score=164.81 TRINITY_DN2961_c0_g1_i1:48-1697(+)